MSIIVLSPGVNLTEDNVDPLSGMPLPPDTEGWVVPKIVTHSGIFHADEVFACAALSLLGVSGDGVYDYAVLRHGDRIPLTRTRDSEQLEQALADPTVHVVDVGGVYDPDMNNFDHHQREGKPEPRPNGVPYSSFGLVWKKYGSAVVDEIVSWFNRGTTHVEANLAGVIDVALVQGIDSIDCGALERSSTLRGSETPVRSMSVSAVVGGMNPTPWIMHDEADEDDWWPSTAFARAMDFAAGVIRSEVYRAWQQKVDAPEKVRAGVQDDGKLIVLEEYTSWPETAVLETSALYCVYPALGGGYNVQQVPNALGAFGGRKSLPEPWRGLRSEELSELTGVEDATFCHNGGFICGAKSLEGALALANKAIAY